jgi:uncharacterized protein (TIGR03083 family)
VEPPVRPPLPIDTYTAAIRVNAGALAAVATAVGPDATVPTCPGWAVRDLVQHLGGVHRWATGVVGTPHVEAWKIDLPEVVGTWPSDDELSAWLVDGADALVATLEAADPALECFTFLKATSPLAMWSRRQAHETAIHRADGEAAAGAPAVAFEPAFAADGVDELLACFITRGRRFTSDPARTLRVTATDTDGDWDVGIGPDGVTTVAGGSVPADTTVRGAGSDVYQALWNRPPATVLDVSGDPALLDQFLDTVHVRWA